MKEKVKDLFGRIMGTNILRRRLEELQYARIFHDTLDSEGWFNPAQTSFSLGRYAVGYNYYYVVYRILTEMKPKKLLELGLGQSTLLIGAYVNHFDDVKHIVVEHDKEWIQFFKLNHKLSERTMIQTCTLHKDNMKYMAKGGYIPTHYDKDELFMIVQNKKFDFISIDAPFGEYSSKAYNRMDLIPFLPQILAEDFVIVIDDFNRKGERNMALELKKNLEKNGIVCTSMTFFGESDVHVIVPEKLKFLVTV